MASKHFFNGHSNKWDSRQIATSSEVSINNTLDTWSPQTEWKATGVGANVQIASIAGDSAGAGYLRLTLDPTKPGQGFTIIGREQFRIPATIEAPITLSQRILGYNHTFDVVNVDADTNPVTSGTKEPDRPITSNIVVTSNVATLVMAAGHTLHVGDLVYVKGAQDSRMNVGWTPVVAVTNSTTITIALTIANATYTVGAECFLEEFCPTYKAQDCFGLMMGGAQTTSQGQAFSRTSGSAPDISTASTLTTSYLAPTVPSGYSGNYTISQGPTAFTRINLKHQGGHVQTQSINSGSIGAQIKINRTPPDLEKKYAFRFTGYAQDNLCVPVGGGIVSIAKAGSTTCTVVFRSAHGLTTSDYVTLYGVRDQTNFVNTTTAVVVSSIVSPTSITILVAGTGTATSYGGQVMKMNGANTVSNVSSSIQSVACTVAGRLTITFLASQGTHLIGESVYVTGLEKSDGSGTFATAGWAEGLYQIEKNDTTAFIMEVAVPGLEAFASVNVGGTAIKATDFNIKFVRVEAYNRSQVEITGSGVSNGITDANEAVNVNVTNNAAAYTAQTVGGAAAHDAAISGSPVRVAGRALSAAYTTVATGDTADLVTDLTGGLIVTPHAIPELRWQASDQITNSTTAIQLKALTASNKNYVKSLQIAHATLGAAMEIQLRSPAAASPSATIASNTLVMAATYGFKPGDLIYVVSSTVTGLTAANYFYILTVSTTSLTFSATRGGTTLAISGSSVTATIAQVMWRTQLQTTALPLQNITFDTPLQGGVGLAVEMCTPAAQTGRIDFNVQGFVAP